jgi:sodium/hydrogen exchanger 3
MISLEILAFFTSYILKKTHFKYLQDAGATMLFGTLIGIITRFVKTDTAQRLRNALSFNSNVFFLFFLPPIIFESGYSMKRKNFFQNLGSICAYAFGGTTIATFMTGILLYGVVKTGWMIQMSFLECLIWGSLISATDPVTVLAIFKELKVDLDLYSNVFGESVLNDAVAIVLYRTVLGFLDSPLSVSSFFLAIGQFTLIFVGSCLIGTFIALLSSLFFKYVEIYRFSYLETAILLLFAYSSYLIADGVQLSGIVSVLFCGIVMAHYTYNNLSELSKELSANLLSVFAMLTETLVFVYLGLALFTSESNIDIVFIVAGIIVISIARAANIYPLTFLVNLSRPRERWITQKYQFFMWFAGLRGAIAFVLSLDVPTPNGPYMNTTTIAIIFFTVLVEGGFTIPLLQKLKIPMNVTKPPDISEDAYGRLNVKVQHSFF